MNWIDIRMGILQVFDDFYEDVPAGTVPAPGHLFRVPTPNVEEVPRILDVERATPTEHEITSCEICEIAKHHFSKRERLPIKRLALGDTEELIISKAKKRPVVVLSVIASSGIDTLPDGPQRRLARHLKKPCYLVAPLYSTTSMTAPGTFGPTLVARIRALQYLHFFCLPDKNRPDRPGSIIRLDRVFPTYLGRGSAPMDEKIHEEPFEILLSQLSILTGAVYRKPYELARELVKDALPTGLDT
ncbi:hypothetical protein [Candidatus Thiosymbion oneisti]|uniref:hypothetical protein n=1 Tax=Candidatus Thiosymbion oneisti TaxID=589554 RepID=UPI000AFA0BF4|nr:hypothetical protein [Candidatus Thiosymbion oneisti]